MTISRTIWSLLALFAFVVNESNCQLAEKLTAQNPCIAKTTCSECIQTKSCAWCYQQDFGDRARCFQPSLTSSSSICDEKFTWNPDNEQRMILQEALSKAHTHLGAGASMGSSSTGSSSGGSTSSSSSSSSSSSWSGSGMGVSTGHGQSEVVQISPQKVGLKLRINEVHRLHVYYAQAEDYPVDLYYLMDLSKSMEDDKEKLSALGDLLSEAMRNITSNFRLGFGSFVDKVVMPYVSTVPKNLIEPCPQCAAPYGFQNVMQLSRDTYRFAGEVRNASVSGNLDAPEGGFDAIMQAVVCRERIGWREKARRLLVFSTDAGFHYAGDGKLGGIITPNDGECHMDSRGMYSYSSVQDYPSISQLNQKVKQNAINVIFAVTASQYGVYSKLSNHIEGSSSGTLSEDSSNVVDLVKEQYSKISSSVEMKDNATSAVKIKYHSHCLSPGSGLGQETNKCDGLKVGDVVKFSTEIVVTECPPNASEWHQTIQIYPVGINESLIVELEMLCDCPCEHPGDEAYQPFSPKCGGAGTYMCGICDCDPAHFGRHCECSATDVSSELELALGCRPDNTTLIDCSGKGTCVCGVCECEQRANEEEQISGKFCECDNFSCDRHNGVLCSGPEHGVCVCGHCECLPGWTGSSCDCRDTNATCIAPGAPGDEMCSGHGECECGVCRCHVEEEGRYSGRYCEKCPTCPGRCQEFKECVMCQMYKTGPLTEEECGNCTFTPIGQDVIKADEEKDEHLCSYFDEDDCRFTYVYSNEEDKVIVRAQNERECPPKVFMLGIVLGVIAAIVLIGLAFLLLWKLLTTIHDRREFARFEKERMMAKWETGENPIYKQATSTFKNPTYAGKGFSAEQHQSASFVQPSSYNTSSAYVAPASAYHSSSYSSQPYNGSQSFSSQQAQGAGGAQALSQNQSYGQSQSYAQNQSFGQNGHESFASGGGAGHGGAVAGAGAGAGSGAAAHGFGGQNIAAQNAAAQQQSYSWSTSWQESYGPQQFEHHPHQS